MKRSFVAGLLALCVAMSAAAVNAAEDVKKDADQAEQADQAAGKSKKADSYPDVSVKELKGAIEKNKVTVIDVNGTDSYRDGHIPGAIDFEANAAKLEKILPKDKNALIVAYCGGPECMAYKQAAKQAVAMGYTNVKHLSAGISGWKRAGEKVEKAEKQS